MSEDTPTTAPVEETPKPEKPPKVEQNGVTRPKEGSITRRIWTISDELSAAAQAPAERKDVMAQCKAEGLNPATVATQYGRWRKFNGLKRPEKVAKPTVAKAPAEAAPTTVTPGSAEAGAPSADAGGTSGK